MSVGESGQLSGASVLVAGAGLAGLAAARDLLAMGANVTVVDARDRVGGRVLTIRDGFIESQHAEAGADMIDEEHQETRRLAGELGLKLTRVLRGGFGYAKPDKQGRTRIAQPNVARGWERLSRSLGELSHRYRLSDRRWDNPIAADLARQSVSQWLQTINADEELRSTAVGLRGFFLADPDNLSLLALVDQFGAENGAMPGAMYRIEGGNDQLTNALAAPLRERLQLDTELVAVSHRGRGVRVSVRHRKNLAQIQADYVIFALPASLLRRVPITPALPAQQHEAISRLSYGKATKTLVQCAKRVWRAPGRPRAFGSPQPFGAVWDGNEEQRGKAGILALMAGGSASDGTREILAKGGINGLVQTLDWLNVRQEDVVTWRQVIWEADVWARGGYAFFDQRFDPALRDWLARPAGPLFFAGEHTSIAWQGYMNGAIESGRRAAAEVAASRALATP